jgi:hypothetical protein
MILRDDACIGIQVKVSLSVRLSLPILQGLYLECNSSRITIAVAILLQVLPFFVIDTKHGVSILLEAP